VRKEPREKTIKRTIARSHWERNHDKKSGSCGNGILHGENERGEVFKRENTYRKYKKTNLEIREKNP